MRAGAGAGTAGALGRALFPVSDVAGDGRPTAAGVARATGRFVLAVDGAFSVAALRLRRRTVGCSLLATGRCTLERRPFARLARWRPADQLRMFRREGSVAGDVDAHRHLHRPAAASHLCHVAHCAGHLILEPRPLPHRSDDPDKVDVASDDSSPPAGSDGVWPSVG